MNNSQDRTYVQNAMQDELQSMADLLPSLRTGEAIISGEGVKIPSRVQFYRIENAVKSSDPDVAECWSMQPEDNSQQYDELISLWQNQKFN